jgi:asparagine synthase (glutamine-hydrolysing)
MGMAHSIEGRVPFLDHRIIEFIFSVPEKVMLEQSHTGKSALKSIAAKTLGKDFVYRRKKGFQAPVSDWKDGLFKPWVELLVLFSERTSIFNVDGVNAIVEHGGRRYFTLVNFMIWYLIFIENVLKDKLPNLKSWDQY